jgi:N-acetyl-anhydromuramyl-L-alanine amidase AmpD
MIAPGRKSDPFAFPWATFNYELVTWLRANGP